MLFPSSKPSLEIFLRTLNGSNGTNGSHHGSNGSNGSNGNGALASASLLRSETASGNPVQVGRLLSPAAICSRPHKSKTARVSNCASSYKSCPSSLNPLSIYIHFFFLKIQTRPFLIRIVISVKETLSPFLMLFLIYVLVFIYLSG